MPFFVNGLPKTGIASIGPIEKSKQRNMINDQIRAYMSENEITRREIDNLRNTANAPKRRIEEKQINKFRRNSRAASLLGGQATEDMSNKLGG
jgi:hypothetical protein